LCQSTGTGERTNADSRKFLGNFSLLVGEPGPFMKLLALQYSIRFYAFARAAIGALVLGKIILLMEMAERKRGESRFPRAIVVAFKTVIYALAVFLFEFGERVARAWYDKVSLQGGLAMVKANAHLDHFLALLILICMVIAMYLAMEEISHAMGEGALTRLFFKRPDCT
jgi:fumarate reductase subunit D